MRVVIAPAGSRGDFQPLLAFAVGLRAAGHDVLFLASPNFAAEVKAFGVPCHTVGFDVEQFAREIALEASPLRATYELFKLGRQKAAELIDEGIPLVRGADVLVGGGAQVAGPTVADAAGIPYVMVAYTPQALWSSEHPPFTVPGHGLPRFANRLLWRTFEAMVGAVFGGPIGRKRRALGLPPVTDWYDHFFPRARTILASDPELAAPAGDSPLAAPPVGSFHLDDARPLDAALERFLERGPPPVYIGFGSMPDTRAARTSALLLQAVRAAGVRAVVSRGWAGFDGDGCPDVLFAGPASHALLFPRVAAVVHHGGAGTTAAAARAGRPQVVVPHVFDQFHWAKWVHAAGLGPPPFKRGRLTAARLAQAIRSAVGEARFAERAAEVAQRMRARDSVALGIAALEGLRLRRDHIHSQ